MSTDNHILGIFLVTQNRNRGYDTHDKMIVCAESEHEAQHFHPDTDAFEAPISLAWENRHSSWCRWPHETTVTRIGTAKPGTAKGLVLASFNAG